jgi:predicted ATP-grasp superfamily ATP-dependent carboligase
MAVLVTSANSLKALTSIRSLGKQDLSVVSADQYNFAFSSYSKYSKIYYQYESPEKSPDGFLNSLDSIVRKENIDVIIPTHSEDTYVMAKYKSQIEKISYLPLHDYSIINNVNDKGYLMEKAEEIGIRVPKTFYPQDFAELENIAAHVGYPAVIKLRNTSSSIGLSYVYSEKELIDTYESTVLKFALKPDEYPLVQEYIVGGGYGVSLLFNHGEVRAKFTHQRIREYPISGGPSTYRVSISHPKMEEIAIQLMEHFNWHGLAMVEFKLDEKTGEPVLIEINPRMWGSINQAVQSGVDFPYLLYKMAVEGDVKPVMNYKLGVKTRNIFTDTFALWKMSRKTGNVGLLKGIVDFSVKDDIIDFKDPLPTISFLKRGFDELLNSRYQ